jgi:hypothetical protein
VHEDLTAGHNELSVKVIGRFGGEERLNGAASQWQSGGGQKKLVIGRDGSAIVDGAGQGQGPAVSSPLEQVFTIRLSSFNKVFKFYVMRLRVTCMKRLWMLQICLQRLTYLVSQTF